MKIQTEALLIDLENRTKQLIQQATILNEQPEAVLNHKRDAESWSALECLEHLNLYGRFYIPEIKGRIRQRTAKAQPVFKSGWLGNYFANSMLPKEKLNKMNTFKNMNPVNSKLDKKVIEAFISQQQEMLQLLEKARTVSLNKTRTSITLSNLIKLKLGDTLRFVIYHNQRHMIQAEKALMS